MKIHFLGAAQTVTGSCYVIETGDIRFAVDCGLHQGNDEIEKRNWDVSQHDPKNLDFILITHAHIDHSGLLPRVVRHGFDGPIYLTKPTKDLLEIMLLDSAHIQEMETEWRNRKRRRHAGKLLEPLYTTADADRTFPQFHPVDYEEVFEPAPGIKITFRNAGHILGSAFIRIEYEENGRTHSLVFSGDLGRPDQLIVSDPSVAKTPDFLFLESTYGDRDHKDTSNSLDELAEAIAYSYKNREKVVIPAFAVERSQQIIYTLFKLHQQGRLPQDMPVYLDSPLAIKATEIFKRHPEYFDDETLKLIKSGHHPLDLPQLQFTQSTEQSKAINEKPGPAVVISASGMANAGRIKHHLRHNLWRPGASVIFVGYQGVGTPGRKIVNGAEKITIFGEEVAVRARVFTIGGFSGHAGQSEILEWVGRAHNSNTQVVLTHGENSAQKTLASLIREKFNLTVHVPEYLEELVLEPTGEVIPKVDPEKAFPTVDWDFLVNDSNNLYAEFRRRIETIEEKPWVDQIELRDQLMDINRKLVELISEL